MRRSVSTQTEGRTSNTNEGPAMRVLLVEDNAINQLVASEILAHFGCSVVVVSNGAEALKIIMSEQFDLVFMDCQMPIMNGYQATEEIRIWEKDEDRKSVPIIALTANALNGEKGKCLQVGMNDYMTKPFTVDAFEKVLIANLPAYTSLNPV